MSYGQGGPQSQWDPWKPNSQQPWNSGGDDGTPDWAALAEASETRNKRRKLLFIGGGAIATIAVGTAVAMAVVSANGSNNASGNPTNLPASASVSGSATPSFAPTSAPPPLDPRDFISTAKKDKAPISADTLFPGTQLTVGTTVYKKGATADTTSCASAAGGKLPQILTANSCTRLIRATYTNGGIAATIGVALFDTQDQATKVKRQAAKNAMVRSLSGKGVKDFCNAAVCLTTANSVGRYAYFTTVGFTDGKNVTNKDSKVFGTGNDLQQFTFDQIIRRGRAQASAATNG
ncbi:hypothetical protein [Streptomyces camelliae]|uniref:Tat pathway signal sequence domain protein n=1 Tax=Streptomyces camelliae TaxID=3004093 RepID=A0ABY7P6D6_9ACTN|nr:hypothetical protein [Streptomyces sp. HUAS 2-6]WBO64391.1 hypothetical protein O1G22_16895 [Streptomyces sp. HUAS 2-6]